MIAMDCEMVGVGNKGDSALARVSVVNSYGAVAVSHTRSRVVALRLLCETAQQGDRLPNGVLWRSQGGFGWRPRGESA